MDLNYVVRYYELENPSDTKYNGNYDGSCVLRTVRVSLVVEAAHLFLRLLSVYKWHRDCKDQGHSGQDHKNDCDDASEPCVEFNELKEVWSTEQRDDMKQRHAWESPQKSREKGINPTDPENLVS